MGRSRPMSHRVLSTPHPGRRALAGLLTSLAVAGCGVRIDGPPPVLPAPDGDEPVRQHAAVLAEHVANAARRLAAQGPGQGEVDQIAGEARLHVDALGGVWRPPAWATTSPAAAEGTAQDGGPTSAPTPTASPTREEFAELLSEAAAASCDGAVVVEAADLATLLASVCLAQRRAAAVLGVELDALQGHERGERTSARLLADSLVGSSDVARLARALDAAAFAHEVAAARASDPLKDDLAARARAHRETAELLLTAAGTAGTAEDPRHAAYALSGAPEPGGVEAEVVAAWTAVLGSADVAGRRAVLAEMDSAARAAAAWGAPPDPLPGLG